MCLYLYFKYTDIFICQSLTMRFFAGYSDQRINRLFNDIRA